MEVTGHSIENLAKAKINNMLESPLIHKASSSITEGSQIGQAKFPPFISMLTTPNHMVHDIFDNDFPEDLLYYALSEI